MTSEPTETSEIQVLPEELIFEDSAAGFEVTDEAPGSPVRRTVAFLADAKASTFQLPQTIEALVKRQQVEDAIVDLSTAAGVTVARQLIASEIDFSVFDTQIIQPTDELDFHTDRLLAYSQGTVPFDIDNLTSIDANIVVITSSPDDAGPYVDVSVGTVAGAVVEQTKAAQLSCLMVLPPESGLRRQDDGGYVRLTLRLAE
jgi:hypothetical protein